jgi:two-component system chemotaxis response regulator CheY
MSEPLKWQTLRILVVDDVSFARKLISTMLNQMGILNVSEASNGDDALIHLGRHPVDLLICDWHMPNMTGLEVLSRVRSQVRRNDLPVLMVTSEQNREKVQEAIHAGVTSYIVKPFQPATLKAHIHLCLRTWRWIP